jgi:nucleotide-binding universal stress UspA family protein
LREEVKMFQRVLLASDGSAAADRALFRLGFLALDQEAEVVVVHSYELPSKYSATDGYEKIRTAMEAAAQEVVDDAVANLSEIGVAARGYFRQGPAARVILEAAQEEKSTLIVLGTRGPSGVAELLLGSVSAEVLRFAQCPVLAIP